MSEHWHIVSCDTRESIGNTGGEMCITFEATTDAFGNLPKMRERDALEVRYEKGEKTTRIICPDGTVAVIARKTGEQ